ncbi:MAG: hypothetical protein JOZ58_12080 [Acetobacteraceae bacterium]|nr:hypothetical protein [Acetobacteraceae bacterium]
MNTDLKTDLVLTNSGPDDGLSSRSVVGSVIQLAGKALRGIWAGYVRNLERAGALPPQL